MTVESILREKGEDVTTISPSATVQTAADLMRSHNIAALVVMSGDVILGVIAEREIVHALSRHGDRLGQLQVKDIVARGIVTAAPQDSLRRVLGLMTRHRTRHLPVLRHGKLTGIVSMGDVVKRQLGDNETEKNVPRDVFLAAH